MRVFSGGAQLVVNGTHECAERVGASGCMETEWLRETEQQASKPEPPW